MRSMTHGPVMLDLRGIELEPDERELLLHPATGGVILFARNYASPDQLYRLVRSVHELRAPSLIVAADQEGGRVQRFREGMTRLPPPAWYGQLFDQDRTRGLETARLAGWLMAAELRACGLDLSFAPVLDLDRGLSSVIGDRALHRDPEAVAELARAWVQGVQDAGMVAVGKHFPGHGGVVADSHLELPVDPRTLADIEIEDLVPFERLIHAGLGGIMPAHVVYPQVDDRPAGFSPFWIRRVLRERLGFQGVVFSDDLGMGAAAVQGGYRERAAAALEAGCDLVLVCNDQAGAAEVLRSLEGYADPVAQSRIARIHGRGARDWPHLRADPRWHEAVRRLASGEATPALDLPI
jgi:beta-N-acetylhexosaminidase